MVQLKTIIPFFQHIILCGALASCANPPAAATAPSEPAAAADTIVPAPEFIPFSRDSILSAMKRKVAEGKPLVAHVFVPLCDNEHQGIVPVNASLGDGMNLNTNLYWGARYGVRSYFKSQSGWKLVETRENPFPDVLERLVFRRTFPGGHDVILIADAWRGDRMEACVAGFFAALAGSRTDSAYLQYGFPDLVAFNGHNGMMDNLDLGLETDRDTLRKDAVVIACASHSWFRERLNFAGAYPLVATNNLMAPEAYVLEAVISHWARFETEAAVLDAAGRAYHQYQQCGERGARRLFRGGW